MIKEVCGHQPLCVYTGDLKDKIKTPNTFALNGAAELAGHHPQIKGLWFNSRQGPGLGCRFSPWLGCVQEATAQ